MGLVRIPGTRYFALDWVVQLLLDAGWQESYGDHVRDGHRVYATQLNAWNYFLRGGPAADNPDRPDVYRLPHPKGFGLDIDPSLDWFMQRAGFWRPFYDAVNPATGVKQYRRDEPWHYEPRGIRPYDYPIIRDQPSGSGAGTVEEDMTPQQAADLEAVKKDVARIKQALDNVESAVLGKGGLTAPQTPSLMYKVNQIFSRINWAKRGNGTPFLIAVQGDIDTILKRLDGIDKKLP